MPCYAAVRPNAWSLSVNQGKGVDDPAAQVSAAMEACEFAIAEHPRAEQFSGTIEELTRSGQDCLIPSWLLPHQFAVARQASMSWLRGYFLPAGAPVFVPKDCAALVPGLFSLPFAQSSNGLGAGFSLDEAAAHAFCELIERDSLTMWSLEPVDFSKIKAIANWTIEDEEIQALLAMIQASGCGVNLFDLTSDVKVPVIMALLRSEQPRRYFDVASGVCAHPCARKAALGAILEAAQTRVSNIAGARDDIDPLEYDMLLPKWIGELISNATAQDRQLPASIAATDFAFLPEQLHGRTVIVPLSDKHDRVQVVRMLSEDLEDRPTNVHWRPGRRAIRAMTRL